MENLKVYYRVYDTFEHEIFASKHLVDCLKYISDNQKSEIFPYSIRKVFYALTDDSCAYVVANFKVHPKPHDVKANRL